MCYFSLFSLVFTLLFIVLSLCWIDFGHICTVGTRDQRTVLKSIQVSVENGVKVTVPLRSPLFYGRVPTCAKERYSYIWK